MTPIRLYVNVDHVATLRQARHTDEPDPVEAARLCREAGADGITAHLREDRRHINDGDLERLAAEGRGVLNIELATDPRIVDLVCRLQPHQATLVPERREEITTEGGLDLSQPDDRLAATIRRLQAAGIRVSLFVDPTDAAVDASRALGVPALELHTGRWAHTWRQGDVALEALRRSARRARAAGIAVHAGHGLTRANVGPIAAIEEIEELNIGHTIVSRAVMIGLPAAVREIRRAMDAGRPR
jgi:pyridoxine 5-phosphate synthase